MAVCRYADRDGKTMPIERGHEDELRTVTRGLHEDGFWVIAVAYHELPAGPATYGIADESGLTLLGYIAFLDPPKETALFARLTPEQKAGVIRALRRVDLA